MKKYLLLMILLLAAAGCAGAAEQTLITGEIEHGGYAAPVVKFSTINNDFAVFIGGQGGWIINHKLVLGGGGYGLVTDHVLPDSVGLHCHGTDKLSMGYGGLFFGYVDGSDHIMHPTLQLLIGGGAISPRQHDDVDTFGDDDDDEFDDWEDYDAFFVLEPQMGIEVNFTTFMRLEMSLSYRWVSGIEKYGYADSDISGPSGTLAFKFGRF
jgi:hypothetical protein